MQTRLFKEKQSNCDRMVVSMLNVYLGAVKEELISSCIVLLYKRMGDKNVSSNWKNISRFSVLAKLMREC